MFFAQATGPGGKTNTSGISWRIPASFGWRHAVCSIVGLALLASLTFPIAIILLLFMNFPLSLFSSFAFALLIAQGPESGAGQHQSHSPEIKNESSIYPDSMVDDPEHHLYWRMTRDGWRQIEMPKPILAPVFRIPRPVPRIHPFQATMLISLAALAAMAWASDEWDWGRLVKDDRG